MIKMPRNKIQDLSDHLFEQLERLNDEDLTPEQLSAEAKRARAMAEVSKTIIEAGALSLRATRMQLEYGEDSAMPKLLETKEQK
jgi:phage-related baseplate assembly protein